jgi:transposase
MCFVMATIHTNSIREELARIKEEFASQTKANKVSPESSMLIKSLIMLLELVFSIFLEKTTRKTSRNSNKPSSQTGKDNTSISKKGSNSKGKSEDMISADNSRTVVTDILLPVNACSLCGESLERINTIGCERRTRIDIVFEKTVEHFDAEMKECPRCHETTKAEFPKDIHGKLQYGTGLKAFVIHLMISQMVAVNRVKKMIVAMIGKRLSEATLLDFVLRLHLALENWEQQAKNILLVQPTMHVDETSIKVNRKNYWIHVHAGGNITLKLLHPKRGNDAIVDNDIITRYDGCIIHDCWASYLSYTQCTHGLCGSHLLRELTFIFDSNQYKWAKAMKHLLQAACRKVSKSKSKKLTKNTYKNLQKRYRTILTCGAKEMPKIPMRSKNKNGKIAKSDAHNLWDRLKKYEDAVLRFARDPNVPFTNNRAEQDLRMAKVKQKVSGCFRSEIYAKAYCRISSYLQTMANKGINPLIAIQMALNREIGTVTGE